MPRSARSPLRKERRKAPRTERDVGLDRIQETRASVARKSLWLKRGTVAVVAGAIGFGVLQGWLLLRLAAIPAALWLWWMDASLTRTDERLQRLYDGVFEGKTEPPLMGTEMVAAAELTERAGALRRAMLSGPGASLHWMMAGVAVLFNILG